MNTPVDVLHSKALPDLLAKLLHERQTVLVRYHHLIQRTTAEPSELLTERLSHFAQLLTDYLALGHFEVYESLALDELGRPRPHLYKRLQAEYADLDVTMQQLLDVADRLDDLDDPLTVENLASVLSEVGELLATRFSLEDNLIEALRIP